ncbi:MAG: hypothetical protein M3094_01020 [Actinomycetia bacterium]|nr:hypothetical protein [Actinomycetes bacterium]
MTDLTADQVIDRCRSYWLRSGVDAAGADDMTTELRSHLQEAVAAGKGLETVTGSDIEAFAEEWASEYRGPDTAGPTSKPTPPSLPRTDSRQGTWGLWLGAFVIVIAVVAVAMLAPKDDSLDQGLWTTVWFVAAAVLAVGEMLTAGFFLLPFAAGAVAAGILALTGVSVVIQLITFAVISLLSLYLLQRFARKDIHGELLPVGAARYIGASALVTETINRVRGEGMVRMGTESWRATTDRDAEIPVGTEVRVIEVRGARLVVEPWPR